MNMRVEEERDNVSGWALSVAPSAVASARERTRALRLELEKADEVVNQARRVQLLELVNAVGTSLFVITGLALSASAAPAVFAGSVLYGGGMIVIRGLVIPESPDGVDIARSVGLGRIGGVMEVVGSDSHLVSQSTARFSKIGGLLVSTASVAFDWIDFSRSTNKLHRATLERQNMEKSLLKAEDSLKKLVDQEVARKLRRDCLKAIEHDLRKVSESSCPGIRLP